MAQFKKRSCTANERLSKATLKAMVTGGTADFFNSLSDDQWNIESFNSMSRNVCVVLYSPSTLQALSLQDQIDNSTDPDEIVELQEKLDNLSGHEQTDRRITVTLPEMTFHSV